jgi:hypothetical protein
MRLLIVYHLRLGDVARCLPIARHFAAQGADVTIECLPEYHGLFELVSYCRAAAPGIDHASFDRVLDPQIWPNRYADFRASGLKWADFVHGLFPEGADIDRQIVLDVAPQCEMPPWLPFATLCFPSGFSQTNPLPAGDVLALAHQVAAGGPVVAVGKREHGMAELQSIAEMCAWIAAAKDVVAINSAPSILASALRKCYFHIPECEQDDFVHPAQIRVTRRFADTAPTA